MRWMIIGAFLIVRPGCSQPIEKPRPGEQASGIVEPESVNVEPAVTTTVNTLALRRAKLEEAASTVVFPTTEANAWLILKSGAARGSSTEAQITGLVGPASHSSIAQVAGENVISKAALFSRVAVGEEFFRDQADRLGDLADDPTEAATIINTVIGEQVVTPGDIDPRADLMVVSRSRLAGEWDRPFDTERTFTMSPSRIRVMRKERQDEKVATVKGRKNRALVLGAGPLTGYFIQVNDLEDANGVLEVIERDGLTAIEVNEGLEPEEIGIPTFELEVSTDLTAEYQKMGVTAPFGGEADFSRITGEPNDLYVGKFDAKTRIKVHETGFEGEATAIASIQSRGFASSELLIDRCVFMFVNEHGAIVAVGRYLGE